MAFPSCLQGCHQLPTLQGTSPFPHPGQGSAGSLFSVGSARKLLSELEQGEEQSCCPVKAWAVGTAVRIHPQPCLGFPLSVTLTQIPKDPGFYPPAL